MPISVVCNSCHSKLNAPDAAAGESVKCPKCKASLLVPAAAAPAIEVVDDPEPPKSELPPKKKKVVAEDDADDDSKVTPKAKKKPRPTDDGEDEDDADEKPKKKKKKKAVAVSSGNRARNIIGGIVLLIAVGIAGFVWYDRSQKVKETETANNGGTSSPGQTTQPGQTPPTQPGQPPPVPKKQDVPFEVAEWKPDSSLLAELGDNTEMNGFMIRLPKTFQLKNEMKSKTTSQAVLSEWNYQSDSLLAALAVIHIAPTDAATPVVAAEFRQFIIKKFTVAFDVVSKSTPSRGTINGREFERVRYEVTPRKSPDLGNVVLLTYTCGGMTGLNFTFVDRPESTRFAVIETSIRTLRKK